MKCSGRVLIFVFIAVVLLCGCLAPKTPVPEINYYTLEYASPVMDLQKTLPCILRMDWFQVAPLYNTTQIIYGDTQFVRNAYHYHKWRSLPGDMITSFLTRDFQAAGFCHAVLMQGMPSAYSHVVQGVVNEFYEKDELNSGQAVITVTITLSRKNEPDINKRILMQKQYHVMERCSRKSPLALAEAMSRAMAEISGLIIQDIYKHLVKAL